MLSSGLPTKDELLEMEPEQCYEQAIQLGLGDAINAYRLDGDDKAIKSWFEAHPVFVDMEVCGRLIMGANLIQKKATQAFQGFRQTFVTKALIM